MKHQLFAGVFAVLSFLPLQVGGENRITPVDLVNPFIGTSNFGTTHPGAVCPNGLMSVVPFNVMGSEDNKYDKDSRWWSTPYTHDNVYFTGYSHVNLSGVGCPEMGSLLLMPTTGALEVDYKKYGSTYTHEVASPGYYANHLSNMTCRQRRLPPSAVRLPASLSPRGRAMCCSTSARDSPMSREPWCGR